MSLRTVFTIFPLIINARPTYCSVPVFHKIQRKFNSTHYPNDKATNTAVVTGASSGIGQDITERLLTRGWKVCLISRSFNKMRKTTENYPSEQVKIIECDVSESNQIITACDQITVWCNDVIHLLVNNAGYADFSAPDLDSVTSEHWDQMMNTNVRSAFLFTKYLKKCLQNASKQSMQNYDDDDDCDAYDGNVINISSVASTDAGFCDVSMDYSVSKAAMNQLTRLNALELSKDKVRVNAILPSATVTNFAIAGGLKPEQVPIWYNGFGSVLPLGRAGKAKDITDLVMFLINKKTSSWITGQLICCDGGDQLHSATTVYNALH